ncbi:hypothetical protein SeLEV6574_g05889 [Synchytrium endobioticum]|uniref:SAM domain-containing protein n=1 Tax=Synchytrium endobioticum TaxID=286115 RepID=A0A507CRS6_9FUNG|nr:hypothetical protein SeLEV6574_g05889 [Synchytrium endobioticum]
MATNIATTTASSTSTTAGPSINSSRHSLPVPEPAINPQRLSAVSAQELYAKLHANRPTSEILGAHYKSPEAEAIDKWFEDLSKYESTLEQMAKARLDDAFREELVAIEKWFILLSDPERTTSLYTLLQHANPEQIRFLVQVLSQMAENNPPVTANASSNGSGSTAATVKSSGSNAAPSPAVSPRANPIGSPIQRNESDFESAGPTSRSRRPLYDRHSAPQDGSLSAGLLAFQASMNAAHSRMNSNPLPADGSSGEFISISGDGYVDRRSSAQSCVSSTNSRAQSPSLRPRTPEHIPAGVGEWSPHERTTSLKRLGSVQSIGSGIAGDSMILNNQQQKLTNGYRLADMPLVAPRRSSLANDEAGVVAAEVANLALAPPPSLLATTPTPKQGSGSIVGTPGYATPRSSTATSRSMTPIGVRSPASTASLAQTPASSQRSNNSPHDLMNMSPKLLHQSGMSHLHLSQSSLHALAHQYALPSTTLTHMHPGAGWTHIDLTKTRGYPASDYSDDQEALEGLMMSGLGAESYAEMKARVRNGSVGSVSGHKEKGKIPESVDLELLNDIPAWLRSLRLHKYTPVFEGMNIRELIKLTDEDLIAKGVTALGARRKLTKVFDMVRLQLEAEGIPGHR